MISNLTLARRRGAVYGGSFLVARHARDVVLHLADAALQLVDLPLLHLQLRLHPAPVTVALSTAALGAVVVLRRHRLLPFQLLLFDDAVQLHRQRLLVGMLRIHLDQPV